MKLLLILLFLLSSASFKMVDNDPIWIGTMSVYQLENQQFIIYYQGNYHHCFAKHIIDAIFIDCDTTLGGRTAFDTLFPGLRPIPLEEFCPDEDLLKIEHL